MNAQQRCNAALNRLAKWRTLLAGWQLGTRANGDAECDAVRDHREATLILRAEVSALHSLMLDKGVYTHDEHAEAVAREAEFLSESLSERFTGVTASNTGLHMDLTTIQRAGWMKGWRP